MLELSLERLLATPGLMGVVVTCPAGKEGEFLHVALRAPGAVGRVRVVPGGPSRQASVKAGLDQVAAWGSEPDAAQLRQRAAGSGPSTAGDLPAASRNVGSETIHAEVRSGEKQQLSSQAIVLVHDAARCLAPTDLMQRLAEAVRDGADAVIPGLPVVDTIKQIHRDASGHEVIVATPPRAALRIAQTPQAFRWDVLRDAHEASAAAAGSEATAATDDAALVEQCGTVVTVIPGDEAAFKVTTPEDLERLRSALGAARRGIRAE